LDRRRRRSGSARSRSRSRSGAVGGQRGRGGRGRGDDFPLGHERLDQVPGVVHAQLPGPLDPVPAVAAVAVDDDPAEPEPVVGVLADSGHRPGHPARSTALLAGPQARVGERPVMRSGCVDPVRPATAGGTRSALSPGPRCTPTRTGRWPAPGTTPPAARPRCGPRPRRTAHASPWSPWLPTAGLLFRPPAEPPRRPARRRR